MQRSKKSVAIPSGTFHLGQADEDVPRTQYNGGDATTPTPKFNTEAYAPIEENNWKYVAHEPQSTFSIDVDNASYSNVRDILNEGALPPSDAVRIEEFVNYFEYRYDRPAKDSVYAVHTELSICPWDSSHQLLLVGMTSETTFNQDLPPVNLTFLVDVSGSMDSHNKLPLLKKTMRLYAQQMRPQDHLSIVAYAGAAGEVLAPTSGKDKIKIGKAIGKLNAGGSTAGGQGIELAYSLAEKNLNNKSINRIILATDGDFNIGASSDGEMKQLIESKREKGIYITVLGLGRGNYNDSKMELIADNGNGNYFYIDSFEESRNVLVTNLASTLMTVANDVKFQIEFNPSVISKYRLIGYENRKMENEDFDNDKKDAGDLGAGHQVTALYELITTNEDSPNPIKSLRYQKTTTKSDAFNELGYIKSRFKLPGSTTSKLREYIINEEAVAPSQDFRLATAVACFGFRLRGTSSYGTLSYNQIMEMAKPSRIHDPEGRRSEFIQLVKKAELLDPKIEISSSN